MKLIKVDNPFNPSHGSTEIVLSSARTLDAQLAENRIELENTVLTLNGEILPPERVRGLALREHDCIVAAPLLQNNTLKEIAMIGVMVAAVALGGPLGAAIFPALSAAAATAIGAAIISVGGTLLVNAVASLFKTSQESPYQWAGPQTASRSGLPIPKGYGSIRYGGNIIQSWVDLMYATLDIHDSDNGSSDTGRQWLNILIDFGDGPATGISDIRINDKDIATFSDVAYFVKLGTNTQTPVTASDAGWTILNRTTTGNSPNVAPTADFNRIVNNYPQSQRVRADVTNNFVIIPGTRNDTQRLDVTVQFPQGVWRYDENMVIKRLSILYNVYYKLSSSSTWILWEQHPGDGFSHYYTNIRQTMLRQVTVIDGLTPGTYDVKVQKVGSGAFGNPIFNVEHESDYFGDELWIESVQETCYDSLAYPNSILLGLRVMATDQLSGANIQVTAKVDYDIRGTLPAELSSFSHDNPAVVAYDALTDPLTGGGIDPSLIDNASFAEWAALCDTTVPNDLSGTQKLAVWNGVFDQDGATIWDSFQAIGAMSRATPVRVGTQIGVMLDQPDVPVQVFNVGNIYKDSYSKQYLNIEDRAEEVEVDYINAADDYKERTPLVVIPQEEQDSGYAIKKAKVNLRGCTDTVQAYYWAMHQLLQNQYLLRTHKWDSPAQAIVCRVGNLVLLQHDVPQWAEGGLIKAVTDASTITLDQDFTLADGGTYTLTVVLPSVLRLATTIDSISGTRINMAAYDGTNRVRRLVDGSLDVRVTGYGAGYVTVDNATGLTAGDGVSLYDTDVLESRTVTGGA